MNFSAELIASSRLLSQDLLPLSFSDPVAYTYHTLDYAAEGNEQYLEKFAKTKKRVLFLGMNPGPFGMAQTGVPFGEVSMVKDWMKLEPNIGKPNREHPKRPIEGLCCKKSEVSGRRLWGLFSEKFPEAKDFFAEHLVLNFCPLIWMKESGANLTPDKIRSQEMSAVNQACQRHLRKVIQCLEPQFLIGVGAFAESQFSMAKDELGIDAKIGRLLHPSPASPAANRGWAQIAEAQLNDLGVWE